MLLDTIGLSDSGAVEKPALLTLPGKPPPRPAGVGRS